MISTSHNHRTLGIIAFPTQNPFPFFERAYYELLTDVGNSIGLTIMVFNPQKIDWPSRTVTGYVYNLIQRSWMEKTAPLPTVIYDRCFYVNQVQYRRYQPFVQKLRQDPQIELLGMPMKGKWQLAQIMANAPELSHFFPPTKRYTQIDDARSYIHKYGSLVAKPIAGSHGIGIVALCKAKDNTYNTMGRTHRNQTFARKFPDCPSAIQWLHQFIGDKAYILQPYLHLRTPDNVPYDIRVLMQKDERRVWALTGAAVRTGSPESLTSNLHGGGKAQPLDMFFRSLAFNSDTLSHIRSNMQMLCQQLPSLIERMHGRLCELGIDIGIDQQGRIWLLEVNSKPGRQVFRQMGNRQTYLNAVRRPVLYAFSLLQGK